uniref:Uncharacterized protein n=1 Tax=Bursaphelenchus xylophilus TaxID=6326 RepID=A0A1I7RND2_BURXY
MNRIFSGDGGRRALYIRGGGVSNFEQFRVHGRCSREENTGTFVEDAEEVKEAESRSFARRSTEPPAIRSVVFSLSFSAPRTFTFTIPLSFFSLGDSSVNSRSLPWRRSIWATAVASSP